MATTTAAATTNLGSIHAAWRVYGTSPHLFRRRTHAHTTCGGKCAPHRHRDQVSLKTVLPELQFLLTVYLTFAEQAIPTLKNGEFVSLVSLAWNIAHTRQNERVRTFARINLSVTEYDLPMLFVTDENYVSNIALEVSKSSSQLQQYNEYAKSQYPGSAFDSHARPTWTDNLETHRVVYKAGLDFEDANGAFASLASLPWICADSRCVWQSYLQGAGDPHACELIS